MSDEVKAGMADLLIYNDENQSLIAQVEAIDKDIISKF
jgi:hypothetical protein